MFIQLFLDFNKNNSGRNQGAGIIKIINDFIK